MRARDLIISLVRWRWMPSVVPVVGSLAFVGFAVLVVPDDLGSVGTGADRLSRAARQGVAKKVATPSGDSPEPSADEMDPQTTSPQRPAALPRAPGNNIVQSIFHPTPKTELPVEPVDPNPPPPPAAPPLPAPTDTVYTLPPPAPPVPNAPPEAAPAEPQGITGQ